MSQSQDRGRLVQEQHARYARSTARFDRISFAMRVLEILRPEHMTVAVHEGTRAMNITRGPAWRNDPRKEWVIVSVPPDATRELIAYTLAELAGVQGDPFVINMVITVASEGSQPVTDDDGSMR